MNLFYEEMHISEMKYIYKELNRGQDFFHKHDLLAKYMTSFLRSQFSINALRAHNIPPPQTNLKNV